jgi:hypothetical protein
MVNTVATSSEFLVNVCPTMIGIVLGFSYAWKLPEEL